MAQIFAQEGDTDAAEQSVRAIDDESSRVFAWIGLARAKANLGDNEQAIAALDEAVGLADDLPQLLLKTSAFETSAPLYDELGAADRSHETRRKTLETIATIRSESDRAVAMATLSDVYERTGLKPDENEREMIAAIMRTTLW
jgi:tetratricopeptide (TPR) repeat protein